MPSRAVREHQYSMLPTSRLANMIRVSQMKLDRLTEEAGAFSDFSTRLDYLLVPVLPRFHDISLRLT